MNCFEARGCVQGPMVYVSDYSWCVHNNYCGSTKAHPLTHWRCSRPSRISKAVLLSLPQFKARKARFFCVLVCCTGSAVYLSGEHLKKSRKLNLNWKFYAPKRILYAQRRKVFINITKRIPKLPNISKCRPSKYREVVQEKILRIEVFIVAE